MKFISHYIIVVSFFSSLSLAAQNNDAKGEKATEKKMDERVTLRRNEKSPYGTFYAYEYLPFIFPEAEILIDKSAPGEKNTFGEKKLDDIANKIELYKGKVAVFVVSPKIVPSAEELEGIMNFVYEGNTVFISTYNVGELLLKKLALTTYYNGGWTDFDDSLKVNLVNPISNESESFAYPGKRYDNSFIEYNANTTTILGRNRHGEPNFIRIDYTDGGSIFINLAPLTFSNFFLLHKNNKAYYDAALSYLPKGIKLITWGEYFRTKEEGNSTSRAFSFMMKNPPLAAALWLLLLMFLLIFLFESKRKQKLVAIRPALKNSSLEFVKTIGRLYFQRHDNKNLSSKMTAHLLDHVRTRYNLSTSQMDDNFEKKLAYKSGIDFKTVHDLIYQANYLNNEAKVSDADLLQYNQQLENFYKKA